MPSCDGTGIVTICRLTLRNRSMPGTIIASPGPRVSSSTLPSRNTRPRSYCLTILALAASQATPATSAPSTISTTITTTTRFPGSYFDSRRDRLLHSGEHQRRVEADRWCHRGAAHEKFGGGPCTHAPRRSRRSLRPSTPASRTYVTRSYQRSSNSTASSVCR